MITVRHSEQRGPTHAGWLDSMHTFSFGGYYDPDHMGFGPLRVINEDKVKAGAGFGTHPHNNMEIVSYVLDGALEHKDSMGNGSVIKPGDIQRMSAGSGITHSEYNHSDANDVHFLQIWFLPEQQNIEPGYEQKSYPIEDKTGTFNLVMSRGGREGSVNINQDVDMYVGRLNEGDSVNLEPKSGRIQWVQIAKGEVEVNGNKVGQGDGLAISDEQSLVFENGNAAEVIVFDMKA